MTPLLTLVLALSIPSASPDAPNRQPQLAAHGSKVAIVYASGNSIQFGLSTDDGKTFGAPVTLPNKDTLAAGMHRGPRVAFTSANNVVVSAIVRGPQNQASGHSQSSGNLVAWHSTDLGKTWSAPVRINDAGDAAREGLHAMGGSGNVIYAAWLDLREKGTTLYGSVSHDGGITWSVNHRIYESPDGTICQCCHPSVDVAADGSVRVMFRNVLAGHRDMYVAESRDGKTFGAATKVGEGSWKIEACPMDGGGLARDAKGEVAAVYRRESTVFLKAPGLPEKALDGGKNPALVATKKGIYAVWQKGEGIEMWTPGETKPDVLDAHGAFPAL
ncbi:MAG: sialidase family protein, partial [Bryobacteraceae bacterium]